MALQDRPTEGSRTVAVAPGAGVEVVDGPFTGLTGLVRSVDGTKIEVEITIFGRATVVDLRVDQIELPEADPRARLREEIARDFDIQLERSDEQWWMERIDAPRDNLAGEWAAFEEYRSRMETAHAEQRRVLTAAFDATFTDAFVAEHGVAGVKEQWQAQAGQWTPNQERWKAATEWIRRGLKGDEPEVRAAAEREVDAARARALATTERQDQAEYAAFRQRVLPDAETVARLREAARRKAAALVEPVRSAVRRTHGLELPDHLFTFWAFWQGLTEVERQSMDRWIGLRPGGVLSLLSRWSTDLNQLATRDGLDPRLDFRFYHDPPEFLTVLFGHSDGLHFGLWYDDPGMPADLVASFYSRDGGDIAWDGETVLEAVRWQIELAQFHLDYASEEPTEERREGRLAIALVRAAVMEFETTIRPEHGEQYMQRYKVQPQARIPTVNGAGVVCVSREPLERDLDAVRRAIEQDAPEVIHWAQAATLACAEGRPEQALALGHDLHWLSAGVQEREEAAARLLEAAYRSLGRDALAEIAAVHHRHRDLQNVDIYLHQHH